MFVKFLNFVHGTQGMELNFCILFGTLGIYNIFSLFLRNGWNTCSVFAIDQVWNGMEYKQFNSCQVGT